jgi:signal peptidase I
MQGPARIARRIALSVCALIFLTFAVTAGIAWQKGYRIYVIHTGSMTPSLRPGDAVLDRPAPTTVAIGEVVTFGVNSGPDSVVTHRVNAIDADGIKTKGDANRTPDPWTVKPSDVVGSKVATLPYMGYVLVYLQHPKGIASIITTTLALILLWQLFFPMSQASDDSLQVGTSPPGRRRRHAHRRSNGEQSDDTSPWSPPPTTSRRPVMPVPSAGALDDYRISGATRGDRYPPMLSSRSTWFPY